MKYMSAKEFVEGGYLQEANRLFFHPLGLAMSAVFSTHPEAANPGEWVMAAVQDHRDDPEGVVFGYDTYTTEQLQQAAAKVTSVERSALRFHGGREQLFAGCDRAVMPFGFVVQPSAVVALAKRDGARPEGAP